MQNILTLVLANIAFLGLSEERRSSFISVISASFLKELDFLPKLNCSKETSLHELQSVFLCRCFWFLQCLISVSDCVNYFVTVISSCTSMLSPPHLKITILCLLSEGPQVLKCRVWSLLFDLQASTALGGYYPGLCISFTSKTLSVSF